MRALNGDLAFPHLKVRSHNKNLLIPPVLSTISHRSPSSNRAKYLTSNARQLRLHQMNPRIAKVTLSAIVHAAEDPDKIVLAMHGVGPDAEARPERRRASGHYGNEIQTVRLLISDRSRAESFVIYFWRRLSLVDQTEMIDNLSGYLDESGRLHIRIDKQEAVNGNIILGQTEPIRIEISFDLQGIPNKNTTNLIAKKLEGLGS